MSPRPRRHRRLLLAATLALPVGAAAAVVGSGAGAGAISTTAFGDDFEGGGLAAWSKSGGDWSIGRDGSTVLRQSKAGSELAREFAGSSSWTDYTVQARVKLVSAGTGGFAGIAARATGSSTFVRLVLRPGGRAELQVVRSGRLTVLAGADVAAPAGRWSVLSLSVAGDTARAAVDGRSVGPGTGIPAAGRIGLLTSHAAASFDDVAVSGAGAPPGTATPAPPTPTAGPTPTRPPATATPTRPPGTATPSVPGGTPTPPGRWPTATGTVKVDSTIRVSGAFDGGLRRYYGIGDGGQSESQDPMFDVADGGTVANVIVGAPAGDGIHCLGRCTLRNVWWEDVGEDAATFEATSASATMLVDGGGARSASDKVFQHNGAGTLTIRGFQVSGFGKLYRSCGNCSTMYGRSVVIVDVTATAPGKALVGINTNYGDTARLSRITIVGDADRKISPCDRYTGNDSGKEPPKTGSGPDGTHCLYAASDITYR